MRYHVELQKLYPSYQHTWLLEKLYQAVVLACYCLGPDSNTRVVILMAYLVVVLNFFWTF